MCLRLTVHLSDEDAPRAKEIAKLATEAGSFAVYADRRLLKKRTSVLQLAERNEGCGCSLLTENADWGATTWDMIQTSLPRLARTLRALRTNAQSGFSFEALWEGEKPNNEKSVSIDELVAIVESGRIGTKTKYLVI